MSEDPAPSDPSPRRPSALTSPPTTPAVADALRALGPDYEEALVASIADRVDQLARQREQTQGPVAAPYVPGPGAPAGAATHGGSPHAGMTVSILSLVFGFVLTVIALTAGLAIAGPVALVGILIVWIALVLINLAVWAHR